MQVAKNRYASQQYHDFIGFQVSKPLLERVFPIVYGVELKDVLTHEDLAMGSYRSRQPLDSADDTGRPADPQERIDARKAELCEEQKFLYRLSRSATKRSGEGLQEPGVGTRILSTLLRFMPKIGPFKAWLQQSFSANGGPVHQKYQQHCRSISGFSATGTRRNPGAGRTTTLIAATNQGSGILARRRHYANC